MTCASSRQPTYCQGKGKLYCDNEEEVIDDEDKKHTCQPKLKLANCITECFTTAKEIVGDPVDIFDKACERLYRFYIIIYYYIFEIYVYTVNILLFI